MKSYTQGKTPQEAHEEWKRNWTPPNNRPLALYGRVIVEFGPYASSSALWVPEKQGFTALVVDDSMGELPPGTEIATDGTDGDEFNFEDRRLAVIPREAILLFELPKEAAQTA